MSACCVQDVPLAFRVDMQQCSSSHKLSIAHVPIRGGARARTTAGAAAAFCVLCRALCPGGSPAARFQVNRPSALSSRLPPRPAAALVFSKLPNSPVSAPAGGPAPSPRPPAPEVHVQVCGAPGRRAFCDRVVSCEAEQVPAWDGAGSTTS